MTTDKNSFAREGLPFIFLSLVLVLISIAIHPLATVITTLLLAFVLYFFRNPQRHPSQENDILISPADGKVIQVERVVEPDFLKKELLRVTIFMSPFNVHVNRFPDTGTVLGKAYHKGKFLKAFSPDASLHNERSALHIKTNSDKDVVFVQIAGWLARRIVSYPKEGDSYDRGQIFGVIRFGSRMDVYLPEDYECIVSLEQKVKAGETILARKAKG
ncbi:MAG: phosphatidylserine decarboxylase family protein [Deltaproteobacteria bacterium]|nr:phosphatidylserine decarboxylase family protein [Deltaproteobacteria bacterium]